MQNEIDFDDILNNYRKDPYGYDDIFVAHTGVIHFKVKKGDPITGPRGQWRQIPGTLLYELHREHNPKPFHAKTGGILSFIRDDIDGQFVEAAEKVLTIRYPLTRQEIIDEILKKVLSTFHAPERAKYFFSLDVQARIEKFGQRSVNVKPGEEILTMSLMKRDTPVHYSGEAGIIHSIYFQPGETMDQGTPLLGICPPALLPLVERIIDKVKAEWIDPEPCSPPNSTPR